MLTTKKDLHTGVPVWSGYTIPRISHALPGKNESADVVVIGAGISGAMVAEELTRGGLSVIVLDQRGLIKGSTLASTALLIYEIDKPLNRLAKEIGYDKAARAWRRSRLGLESLHARIEGQSIVCDLQHCSSLYLQGNVLNAHALRDEMMMRNLAGLPTEFVSASDIMKKYDIKGRSALLTRGALSVNPVLLTAGLLKAALSLGARIYSPLKAESLEKKDGFYLVHTNNAATIRAKYVVYASGYEIPKEVDTGKHNIESTWVIATKKQSSKLWKEKCLVWEASEPYLYIRTTEDGRIICGGEDEKFSDEKKRDALIPRKTILLEKKLHRILPGIDCKAEFAWTGSFGASTTGLPSIGQVPRKKNVYAIMAYGGNGITYSRIAAEIISAEIGGKKDPDADLFSFR